MKPSSETGSETTPLAFHRFGGGDDPLSALLDLPQGLYLRWYLADLGARSVLVEASYFDRDYLSEFAAFYCLSAADYTNRCRRLHYFSIDVSRSLFSKAAAGDLEATRQLQDAYLGFIVLRPIPGAPFGRTVICWYPDGTPALPRVVDPSRDYVSNVAGVRLTVHGLAWQQQDSGVGACATVALWSMLHSSAYDDRHVVPTTAEVTTTAHRAGLTEKRAFPSGGLSFPQLVASVRDFGFAPLVVAGSKERGIFTREHFTASVCSFLRSGYPVLIAGQLFDASGVSVGYHAVCAVGFRQSNAASPAPGSLTLEDEATEYLYVHDDNLGPAARFHIETLATPGELVLRPCSPQQRHKETLTDPTKDYPCLLPSALLAAAHNDVRLSPDDLHRIALDLGSMMVHVTGRRLGFTAGSRITRIAQYVTRDLEATLGVGTPELAATRLALWEQVAPMSLHVGVVRIGFGNVPLVDVLYDTTDSAPNRRAFCHIAYHPTAARITRTLATSGEVRLGTEVLAVPLGDAG